MSSATAGDTAEILKINGRYLAAPSADLRLENHMAIMIFWD
jgi:hypothetical protein